VAKHEQQLDTLRFENRSLKYENAEIKKDSAFMGVLMDEEAKKAKQVEDKALKTRVLETELRALK
jgi:hypothetical protein